MVVLCIHHYGSFTNITNRGWFSQTFCPGDLNLDPTHSCDWYCYGGTVTDIVMGCWDFWWTIMDGAVMWTLTTLTVVRLLRPALSWGYRGCHFYAAMMLYCHSIFIVSQSWYRTCLSQTSHPVLWVALGTYKGHVSNFSYNIWRHIHLSLLHLHIFAGILTLASRCWPLGRWHIVTFPQLHSAGTIWGHHRL